MNRLFALTSLGLVLLAIPSFGNVSNDLPATWDEFYAEAPPGLTEGLKSYESQMTIHFDKFSAMYGKAYASEEKLFRRDTFARNLAYVMTHNTEFPNAHRVAMNEQGDLTSEEFAQFYLGNFESAPLTTAPQTNELPAAPERPPHLQGVNDDNCYGDTPSCDWRKNYVVGQVKNQGQCGSCWAFSTVGMVESWHALWSWDLQIFSEKQLVDCVKTSDGGCDGGWPVDALNYLKDAGQLREQSYPYKPQADECGSGNVQPMHKNLRLAAGAMTCDPWQPVAKGDIEDLRIKTSTYGPASVIIDASPDSWRFYSSGVYEDTSCEVDKPTHAVVLDGYGTDPTGGDYWLIRNSWGANWGESGYIRIKRDSQNICGVATQPTFMTTC